MIHTNPSVQAPCSIQGYISIRHLALKRVTILLSIALLTLSGCSSMDGKFPKSESENLGPFATQTIAIVGESDFGFTERRAGYARK